MGDFFRYVKGQDPVIKRLVPMKMLIINADDVGLSSEINEAVRKCYLENVITGASLLACGDGFEDAVEMLKSIGKTSVGVHLVLTGSFKPCTKDFSSIRSLLPGGKFASGYQGLTSRYFMGKISASEVYTEFSAQLKKVKDAGLEVTHLDSHEHIHMLPDVLEAVVKLAVDFDIPYVRLPREDTCVVKKNFSPKDLLRHAGLKVFAAQAERVMSMTGVQYNDVFWGHFHSGRIDDNVLCFIVSNLAEGVNELAVHPGVLSAELVKRSYWHRNAQKEMEALLRGKWKDLLAEEGVCLVTHSEAVDV
jgi:predicted glycoside hydrolase/deacetylase ChbG (UPF0249 family)